MPRRRGARRVFTAAYEGYLVPFVVDENAVRFLTVSCDLDRDASRIALRDGQPVGLANLGLRGEDAWIGGVGVVPSERRRGTGRTLMRAVQDEARSRGVARVWLEVIVENTQAIALYEQLGYGHVRDLDVWSLAGDAAGLRELVIAARSLGETLGILNLPSGHAASHVLAELGGRVDVRQHEMVLRL